jgi:hypothetical protein
MAAEGATGARMTAPKGQLRWGWPFGPSREFA